MDSRIRRALLTVAVAVWPSLLWAQVPRYDVPPRPTVSPYLNLLQSNPDVPAYQTLVRPLIEQRNALQIQSREINRLENQINAPVPARIGRPTGHVTRYFNYSHYYPGMNGR